MSRIFDAPSSNEGVPEAPTAFSAVRSGVSESSLALSAVRSGVSEASCTVSAVRSGVSEPSLALSAVRSAVLEPPGTFSGTRGDRGTKPTPSNDTTAAGRLDNDFARDLLLAMTRFRDGDLAARLPCHFTGIEAKIGDVFNEILRVHMRRSEEIARAVRAVAEQNSAVERKNKEKNEEVERARRALEEKVAEAVLTSKNKSEFLANVSHELRTPLHAILILGQQLAENAGGNLTDRQIDFARSIHSAGTDLLTLINEILDLSKIESGTVTVEPEEITFASLRGTLHRAFRHVAESKGLCFDVEIDPALPASLVSDPKRLQQILTNLVWNALKFTAQGSVGMSVRLVTSGWNEDHPVLGGRAWAIAFAVTDTGIGIALEKQKLVFEAFQQADAGAGRQCGGTGLGLAISRQLANLLGGEIRLQSKPGTGSTFTLYLPPTYAGATESRVRSAGDADARDALPGSAAQMDGTAQSHERLLAETASLLHRVSADPREGERTTIERLHGSREALRGRKVLVVDDDARNIFALATILENQDMDVVYATSGRQAIEIVETTPDLSVVLMDITMPEMDGYETMRAIRRDQRFRMLPILALTARAMKGDREKCLQAGASDYVAKPVDADQLFSQLCVWLCR